MRFETLPVLAGRAGRWLGWLCLLAGLTVPATPPVAAQTAAADDPPIYHHGEIVVTGDAPRVVEDVTTVDVVTAEEIAASGARTVDEAIELLPGLHLRRGAEGVRLLDVRGLRTRNVLLLLDGVPLGSSFDGFFDPETLPVESIARIKLVRGAGSSLYGPAGNGGVLSIVTRAAGAEPSALARVEGGPDTRRAAARGSWRGGRSGAFGLTAAGSITDQDAWELSGDFEPTPLEDGGARLASDREDRAAFGGLTWDPRPDRGFGLNLVHRSGEHGKPPGTEDARTSPFAPRARYERVDFDALSAHAGGAFDLGTSWTLRPALYFNRSDEVTDGFDDAEYDSQEAAGAFRENAEATTAGASLQLAARPGERGRWTVGIDARREGYDARGFELRTPGGGTGGGGRMGMGGGQGGAAVRSPIDEDRSVRIASLAAEYEHSAGPWSAVAGGGYAIQSREDRDDDEGVHALLGVRRALGSAWAIRGSVARKIRFPTLRDLYGAGRGNPDLEAETTRHYELGVERVFGGDRDHRVEMVLYRLDGDDFIQGLPGEPLANTEDTRRQGVELSGFHRLGQRQRIDWSYTYLDAEDRSPGADTSTIQNQPRHKAALAATVRLPFALEGRGDVLHVADSYALSRTRPTRRMELGDYTLVSLGLSRPIGAHLRLRAQVDNLLDESYFESIGFPGPGRTGWLRLELGVGGR